jgi:molybdenum storage protein
MPRRLSLESKLKDETLVRKGSADKSTVGEQLRILPELNIIKVGGHGALDYGRAVMLPLVEELGRLSKDNQLLIVTGGGARVRHIMDVGIDLGMPTGVLAELAAKVSEQNAIMMSVLLSKYNGVRVKREDLLELPMLLHLGVLPVTHGTPPYGLYEHPSRVGMIPPHRTDTGAFLIAEVLGAKNCILVKDVDGLYTEDPRLNPDAKLIEDISANELIELDLDDLVLERMLIELLRTSVNIKQVKIVNGLVRGSIEKAIKGEKVGTIIRS